MPNVSVDRRTSLALLGEWWEEKMLRKISILGTPWYGVGRAYRVWVGVYPWYALIFKHNKDADTVAGKKFTLI